MSSTTFDPNAPDPRRGRSWPKYAALGVVALAIVAGLWPRALPVETAEVARGRLAATVDEEGRTRVRNRHTIAAPVSGQLIRTPLKAGSAVVAGETVVAAFETAASDPLDARGREQAEARVKAAESARAQADARRRAAVASLTLAEAELGRARSLAGEAVISAQELDVAVAREATAREERSAAEFGLKVADYELAQAKALLENRTVVGGQPLLTLTSPVDGRVLRVFEESSRPVIAGTPLLEVGDATDLEVVVDVLSRDAVRIRPGTRVWLGQWGGDGELEARVRLVEPSGFTKISALGVEEQRVNVVADLVDPVARRASLGDGYRVEARIVTAEADNVLMVPSGALFQQAGRWRCYLVAGGRARLREVEPGLGNGIVTEVRSGLSPGDRVIVYPGDKVAEGVRVNALGIE